MCAELQFTQNILNDSFTAFVEEQTLPKEGRYELLVKHMKNTGEESPIITTFVIIKIVPLEEERWNKILNVPLNSTKESEAKSLFFKTISFPHQSVCK